MKTFFTRYRVMIWAVLLLLVLNISVLGTILFRNIRHGRILSRPPAVMRFHRHGPGIFLKEELNLTDEQLKGFMEAQQDYRSTAMRERMHINALRNKYLHDLMQTPANDTLMQATCDSIGLLQARLMKETGNYYAQIRKLCRDDQVKKLNAFFKRAMYNEDNMTVPGGTGIRRSMHRAGRNLRNHSN